MAEQLTILGLWERSAPEADQAPSPPPPVAPPVPPPDPRQHDLLDGPHLLRFKLEEACVALDAAAVRVAHANLLARSIGQTWGDWGDGVAWLVEPASGEESAQRALSLTALHFPGAPRFLVEQVRGAALRRAVQQLTAAGGPGAALSDGRPAGLLALIAGDFVLARALLAAACDASGHSNAMWLGYLGEASWRLGEWFAAMQCWCRASLVDPSRIDPAWVTAAPVLELLDLHDELELTGTPFSYLAVLADLRGKHPLDDFALEVPASASVPRRLAALLRAYRRDRASGALDESGRIEAKRVMARLGPPGLRELLRPL
ncbi:MAG: hypothetical protein Q8L48_37680 [Archangium sp.]|nr:hypothetical protein [Archangium sp.]